MSKKSLALILAISLLVAIQLNNTARTLRPSLTERSAVVIGDLAAIRAAPARFSTMISVCFQGQRLVVLEPSIFDFYRARCNNVGGWITAEQVAFVD